MTVPSPRAPRCYKHHIRMAGCELCTEQHAAEVQAARERLREAAR
jgi:hypothetical protein